MIFIVILNISCRQDQTYLNHEFQVDNMNRTSAEAWVPSSLWDIMESLYTPIQAFGTSAIKEKKTKFKSRVDIPIKFMPFRVYLVERTKNLLGGIHRKLIFGDGGGTLDLKEFVSGARGHFVMGIEFEEESLQGETAHVFFLSNAKQREIAGRVYGAGCHVYMEITDYFNDIMKYDGLKLTTVDLKHVTLMAGTFFFVAYVEGNLVLAQLTVKDSRYKSLHCS